MKTLFLLLSACLGSAVTMSRYIADSDVEAEFAGYLEECAEVHEATTSFTDFFTPDGRLVILNATFVGSEEILDKKRRLLPPDGDLSWDHHPNMTTVYYDTDTEKTYLVLGINNRIVRGLNCSATYYATRFTVRKNEDGRIDLTPHSGNLVAYDDYVIDPPYVPTHIPCAH